MLYRERIAIHISIRPQSRATRCDICESPEPKKIIADPACGTGGFFLAAYDYRTNIHHTLKTNPLRFDHLQNFVKSYNPENRHKRKENERFKKFTYKELIERDKSSLDIFWLKDDSLGDMDNLPDPDVLAVEIADNLESAVKNFRKIVGALEKKK